MLPTHVIGVRPVASQSRIVRFGTTDQTLTRLLLREIGPPGYSLYPSTQIRVPMIFLFILFIFVK